LTSGSDIYIFYDKDLLLQTAAMLVNQIVNKIPANLCFTKIKLFNVVLKCSPTHLWWHYVVCALQDTWLVATFWFRVVDGFV